MKLNLDALITDMRDAGYEARLVGGVATWWIANSFRPLGRVTDDGVCHVESCYLDSVTLPAMQIILRHLTEAGR